ncbi:Crp/Fnr family transcriptional regulator [Thermovibrio sp.]
MEIKECKLFDNFDEEELEILKEVLEKVNFKQGELIFDEFQPANEIFFITDGRIGLYRSDNFSRWMKVAHVYPGTPLGECAFFLNSSHSLRAIAEEPVKAFMIRKEGWEKLKERAPKAFLKLMENILSIIAQRLKSEDFKYSQICGFFSLSGGGKWRN